MFFVRCIKCLNMYSISCVKFISVKLEWWKHVVTKGCGWDNESHFHRLIALHVWGVLSLKKFFLFNMSNHLNYSCLGHNRLMLTCSLMQLYVYGQTDLMNNNVNKQRFLTPGHQGWNDLHSLCRIGMECYLLNNDDNNIIYWIMMIIMIMIIIMIIMMTMMIIGTATIMIMIIIITTTLTMTIMKMIMIKTAQTPCQSLYKDRRI